MWRPHSGDQRAHAADACPDLELGPGDAGMTPWIAMAAIALGALSVTLFSFALRSLLVRQTVLLEGQTDVVATMLGRFDDRLGTFAQTLNDALTAMPARDPASFGIGGDSEPVMRALELALSLTAADGAVALISGDTGAPIVATIGLSEAETNYLARLGYPDYRGARAIEVAFSGDLDAPEGSAAVRSGLVVPLLAGDQAKSLLGVLTRDENRRFSEEDVAALDELVTRVRPAITRSLSVRENDVVPELDPLTGLYDRHSFEAVLEHRIANVRQAGKPLFLLLIDVDHLTTLNAKIGRLGADGVLSALAERLHDHADLFDTTFRLGGGRFALIRRSGTAGDLHEYFESFQNLVGREPIGEAGFISVSAGFADLLPGDDATSLTDRAEDSLADAKRLRRGSAANG